MYHIYANDGRDYIQLLPGKSHKLKVEVYHSYYDSKIEGIKEEFHKAVDNYITACKNDRKEPAKAFTGNYTIRTTPAIHEALALYAARQEVKFSQIMQQALNEFIKNHDIELPNKEET